MLCCLTAPWQCTQRAKKKKGISVCSTTKYAELSTEKMSVFTELVTQTNSLQG